MKRPDGLTHDKDDYLEAVDHRYDCRCRKCLDWWATMGPEDDIPGAYGPFSTESINKRQVFLKLPLTN